MAWVVLAKLNFLYPVGYELLEINKTVTQFSPVNLYKKQFSLTTKDEHIRLFAAILASVLNNGDGLGQINYHKPNGQIIDSLLTQAEILHLNDVAKLIAIVDTIGTTTLVTSVLLSIFITWKKPHRPSLYKYHAGGLLLLTGTVFLILIVGAEKVFYALHVCIFPSDHQWFFYYRESLMTTLMQAPNLFAVIAIELLVLAIMIYALALLALRKIHP